MVSTYMMTIVASLCPQAAHTWNIHGTYMQEVYIHTHNHSPAGLVSGRPWDRSAPWRTGGCFCYYFLPVPPRRHPDISPELEQREGYLKKESEKNKRKRKKEKGRK